MTPPRPGQRPDDDARADASLASFGALPDGAGVAEPEIAALRARVAELTEALAARDSFLAVAAHELRNPMTPILAHAQRLRRRAAAGEATPEQVDEALGRIEGLVVAYVRRATMLLDVSRLTLGVYEPDPARIDAAAVARELVASFEPAAHYAGCALAFEAPPALSARLDRTAFEQILDNLLSNALKYGAGAPVRVALAARRDDGADRLRLTVVDGGPGILPEDRARIFHRFERAVARGSGIGGFGVGLWIVGQLAAAMGGRVEVESGAGRGSTFTLDLPLG